MIRYSRILVTGATGFVGRNMIDWLRRETNTNMIFGVSREAKLPLYPDVQQVRGDLSTVELPDGDMDYIVHAVGSTNQDNYVVGLKRIINYAYEKNVKKFLLLSSGAVRRVHCDSRYRTLKRLAEEICRINFTRGNLPVVVARGFTFIGPYMQLGNFAIGQFLLQGMAGKDITVQGDGRPLRSYLHASDMAQWLWTVLKESEPGKAYDIGSLTPISVGGLALKIAQRFDNRTTVFQGQRDPTAEDYLPDAKFVPGFGLSQTITLDQAIDLTLQRLRERYNAELLAAAPGESPLGRRTDDQVKRTTGS